MPTFRIPRTPAGPVEAHQRDHLGALMNLDQGNRVDLANAINETINRLQ
jgi:hypothetical protein